MIKKIDAKIYYEMLKYGVSNVGKNKERLNDLNVFPVPDGDTGTNMLMTLRAGLENCKADAKGVGELSGQFASSAVFGARGNSGVILSQFLKGIAESLAGLNEASVKEFCLALENGCKFAYLSVAKPVEGTMLTVIREGVARIKGDLDAELERVVEAFVEQARESLEKTPELLPVLKKAGVVDSGGCGILCFFEGFLAYLRGEELPEVVEEHTHQTESIDFSIINKDTPLNYGYCVEGLIQLKMNERDFDIEDFRDDLNDYGNSVVASLEGDKVKLHVHTKKLGKTMDFCQKYGEFLTIKIENMSVQNLMKQQEEIEKFLVAKEMGENFNVVAVANNTYMQKKYIEMGADVVILSEITPSSQDFMTAFAYLDRDIIVFPNSTNSILVAMQAASLCPEKQIAVVNSRCVADCYSALSVLDFDSSVKSAVKSINRSINALFKVHVYYAQKEIKYDGCRVAKNEFFSLQNNEKILCVDETLEKVTLKTIKEVVSQRDSSVVTLVYADGIAEEFVKYLREKIYNLNLGVDVATICSKETAYSFILVFE